MGREPGGFGFLPALKVEAGHTGRLEVLVSDSFCFPGRNCTSGGSRECCLVTGVVGFQVSPAGTEALVFGALNVSLWSQTRWKSGSAL